MFTLIVPKDFTAEQRLTWTIVANGPVDHDSSSAASDYEVSPFADVAVKNVPPTRFEENGPIDQGPSHCRPRSARHRRSAFCVFVSDDARYASGTMAMQSRRHRCACSGRSIAVLAASHSRNVDDHSRRRRRQRPFSGKATTNAKFSEPGDYVLHVVAMDYSGEGGGGEVCCWTTAMVNIIGA